MLAPVLLLPGRVQPDVCRATLWHTGTEVVAPDKALVAIGDQDLAMIQGVSAQVQQVPGTTNATVFQHMDRRMKGGLEGAWDYEIANAVKDDIDGNPLLGFSCKMLLK